MYIYIYIYIYIRNHQTDEYIYIYFLLLLLFFFKYNGMDRPAKFESHKRVSIYRRVLDHHSHMCISIAPIPSNIMFA